MVGIASPATAISDSRALWRRRTGTDRRTESRAFNVRAQFADAKNELSRRAVHDKETAGLQGVLKDAPQLLVRYTGHPSEALVSGEALVFVSDGSKAVIDPHIGSLTWEERRSIQPISSIGTIPAGDKVEREIWLMESENKSVGLFEFMRQKTSHDAATSVTVTYEDSLGRRFSREFLLTAQIDGGIDWRPGLVKLWD